MNPQLDAERLSTKSQLYATPQDVGFTVGYWTGVDGRSWHYKTRLCRILHVNFPESTFQLDFSHLAAWRTASVKCPFDARGTFCGSVPAGDPQKVPLRPTTASRALGGAGTAGRASGIEDRARSVAGAHFSERCDLRRSVQVGAALASHRADGR